MSDKGRAYSEAAVTIIFKGDGWADVKRHIDDANDLREELREARSEIDRLNAERSTDSALILSLREEIREGRGEK